MIKQITYLFLFLFLVTPAIMAQDDGDVEVQETVPVIETAEEKYARMLDAFEGDIAPGKVVISFENSISKEAAVKILDEFELGLQIYEVCGITVDPDGGAEEQECTKSDSWSDSINAATVEVPEGKEKSTAEKLYLHEQIIWIEPTYGGNPLLAQDDVEMPGGDVGLPDDVITPTDEGGDVEMPGSPVEPQEEKKKNIFARFFSWIGSLFS